MRTDGNATVYPWAPQTPPNHGRQAPVGLPLSPMRTRRASTTANERVHAFQDRPHRPIGFNHVNVNAHDPAEATHPLDANPAAWVERLRRHLHGPPALKGDLCPHADSSRVVRDHGGLREPRQ